ncbi:MAG: ABC transporter substrate-binding protein, partial [Chloroflexi bacterium]|nr:ABC transporter substrate-binding protein [Chloroflexota bacterium]
AVPEPAMPEMSEKEMTVVLKTVPDGLDNHICNYNNCTIIVRNIADPLVQWSPDGFKAALATSWEVSEDELSYTFKLREGVKFHDGTPFNAEAVKLNFERVVNPETKSTNAINQLGPFKSAEVIDEYTVRINFERPYGAFLNVSASVLAMLSPTSFQTMSRDEALWHPVGTGPFMFKEYVPNESVVLVKNPDYNWAPEVFRHTGPAYLDQVTFRFIQEDGTRSAALQSGEVQALFQVPDVSIPGFKADANRYSVIEQLVGGPGVQEVFNATDPLLQDVRMRQALTYATDREMIFKTVYLSQGIMATGPLSPATMCYSEEADNMYAYDPDKALAILEELGWTKDDKGMLRDKDGNTLKIEITSVAVGKGPQIGEVIMSQWGKLGIDARNVILPSAAIQLATAQSADFQMIWRDWGASDPNILSVLFHSKNIGKGWNFSHLAIPELDEFLDQGDMISDPAKRCEVYAQAQKIIADEALAIPILYRVTSLAMLAPLKDLWLDGRGNLYVYDAYVSK